MNTKIAFFALFAVLIVQAQQNQKTTDSVQKLDEVFIETKSIFGSKYRARHRTGSAYYVSQKELKKFNYTDINRVLKSIPGVNFYEEDGFGLRPNISLRGTSPERSAKISLMEDGVLIAPAPYSAPAAYYFPSVARMQAVEVLKGSSQVQYGPFTTGGAINMLSTQIPNSLSGEIKTGYGSFNTSRLHAKVGDAKVNFGYLLEFLNYNSDGFKTLLADENTGFDINEVVAKFRVNSKKDASIYQALEAKFHYYDEDSNETYLGLTESDFNRNPFRRYAGSQIDEMLADQIQLQLTHTLELSKKVRITTDGYYNQFERNWYKLDDVVFNGDKQKIADVVANPTDFENHLAIIKGEVDSGNDALLVKANNRRYISKGIQTKFDHHWSTDNTFNDLEIGLRYHYDEEDRYQWEDGYNMINNVMTLTSDGLRGNQGNRISSARAFSSFLTYKLKYKGLTLTPGLRYENIVLQREDYGSDNPNRNPNDLSVRENKVEALIPGLGFNYEIKKSLNVFGGVHKGFAPPGSRPDEESEESINYELGSRFEIGKFRGEVIGFYNDYSNLLGSDLAASGGTGSLEQFNAGEVAVKGLEVLLNYDILGSESSIKIPLSFGYTFTDTSFRNSFGSSDDLWGEVIEGDELPYIAKHQFNTNIGFEFKNLELFLNARYNGSYRTRAGQGSIPDEELVADNFILDFSGKFRVTNAITFSGSIINLLDETYAVSRVPAGLRPGHPFGANLGLEFRF